MRLRALHLGSTKIKGVHIVELTKELGQLRKLTLKGLGSADNVSSRGTINSRQMQQVGLNLPQLSHLDISGCQFIEDGIFEYFRNVRFVNVWMAGGVSSGKRIDLSRKGVVVIDDIYG